MPNLFDIFMHKPGGMGKTPHRGRVAPRDVKICPGCPPPLTKEAPKLPDMKLPDPDDRRESTKVVTLVNMGDYRKKPKGPKGLF
jgi:hypothetical protein